MARGLIASALLAAAAIPIFAAHQVTVEELHSILVEQKTLDKRDEESARQIGSLELSERLSPSRLMVFDAEIHPGPKTALALALLSDNSAFFGPPADELPALPSPDPAAQKVMLEAAVEYVTDNIKRLPNFLARRTTRSFDDSSPVAIDFGTQPLRGGLH